ncbi:MAG TPA: TVP38/TMEM64 family protein [Actinocatenispora sp.]
MSVVRDPRVRAAALVLLVAAGLGYALVVGVPSPARVAGPLAAHPYLGPLVGVLGIGAATVCMVPRGAVVLLAGAVFGPLPGAGYAMVGALLGALAAFGLGRLLGRDVVARLARGRLARFDAWLAGHGALAVAWSRLLPVLPFGLLNYAFGVTAVGPARFLAGTALGILPSTVAYAWAGGSAHQLRSPAFLASVGAVAALGVVGLLAARLRRRTAPDPAG